MSKCTPKVTYSDLPTLWASQRKRGRGGLCFKGKQQVLVITEERFPIKHNPSRWGHPGTQGQREPLGPGISRAEARGGWPWL